MTDDLISRQAAIVRACNAIKDDSVAFDVKEALKAVPTAEPEIIRCKDCEWWLPPHGCNDTAGLIYTTGNAFCSFAERRTDERAD